jgi:predicted  nucleic acid-binding Zn-ribbon protein
MSENEMQDLKDALVDLAHQIQRMADKQDEMLDDVKKIKEAIYNPDQGLYARVRDLEQWQQGVAKFIWTVGLAVTGLIIQAIYSGLF